MDETLTNDLININFVLVASFNFIKIIIIFLNCDLFILIKTNNFYND